MVQSIFHIERQHMGNLGIVLEVRDLCGGHELLRVIYPKTRKIGWVDSRNMRVVSESR
jgi:hypothetical protein